jgi:hypothetical protein
MYCRRHGPSCATGTGGAAEELVTAVRGGVARIKISEVADLEVAATIGNAFADQDFSLSDRTS